MCNVHSFCDALLVTPAMPRAVALSTSAPALVPLVRTADISMMAAKKVVKKPIKKVVKKPIKKVCGRSN